MEPPATSVETKLGDLVDQHGSKLNGMTATLVLAGVTAAGGLIWQINSAVISLTTDQSNTSKSMANRVRYVDERFKTIRHNNQAQDKRIGRVRDMTRDNHGEIRMLKARLAALEQRDRQGQ